MGENSVTDVNSTQLEQKTIYRVSLYYKVMSSTPNLDKQ